MKDELGGKIMTKFATLREKACTTQQTMVTKTEQRKTLKSV